ncbi:MAG: AAA family ATPase [Desulfobacterales bacterium]|nr:AAA family ATPase [Desulfobacterales bacterium]
MKILQMNLLAFGPFTEKQLDIGMGQEGLHILFGPNEAGKSSALRALRQMLFGIPDRSSDDFIHPYAKLRIGGTLQRKDGTVLEFIRRKGRLNTLQTPDNSALIDESHMRAFLGGVDESLFTTMFGIDHDGLVKGGEEIIRGGGEIGQILFAGGSGISNFRKVQNDLQSEADGLFRPSAQRPKINEAVLNFKKKQKEIREVQLSGQEWDQHDRALRDALEQKKSVDAELDQKLRDTHRLERIREALPDIVLRRELLDELKNYADAVILPKNFSERRRTAITNLRIAEKEERQAQKNLEEIQQAIKESDIPESLFRNADFIEQLYQDLGSFRKAMKDRLRLEGLRSSAETEAKAILRDLRSDLALDQTEQLRLKKTETVRIQELGSIYGRLASRQESTHEEISRLSMQIGRLKKQLAGTDSPHDTGELRQAIENAMQHGNLEAQYQAEYTGIQKTEAAANLAMKRLPLWKGSLEELEHLPVPQDETVEAFEIRFRETLGNLEKYRNSIDELEQELVNINGQIEQLDLEQDVPTENDLKNARHKREQGWHLIRKVLKGSFSDPESEREFVAGFSPASSLPDAYEMSVHHADSIADRLRREADRVAKKTALLTDRETRKKHLARLKDQFEKSEAVLDQIQKQWNELWQPVGILPKSPREMRAWIQKQIVLANQVSVVRDQNLKAERLKSAIEMSYEELSRCLKNIGEPLTGENMSLTVLINRTRKLADGFDKIRVKQDRLLNDLYQKENEQRDAEKRAEKISLELSQWRSDWMNAVHRLGLGADATPLQANAVIDDLKNLFGKIKEADVLCKRIKGIDRDAQEFAEKVRAFTEQAAPDLAGVQTEQGVTELNARLTRTREAKARQQSLEKQKHQEEKKLGTASEKIAKTRAHLSVMCEEAGCEHYQELPDTEERSARRQQISSQLEQIEARLRKLSAGVTLDEFITETQAVDADSISPEINRLKGEIEELGLQKSVIDQGIGSERTELSRMDGSARAALLAEESQGILARLETDVEQYVRLKLASMVLNQAIERYREKNQAPILKRSNELFAHMTLGSFEGLRLEFNEKGDAVLVGVRPGGNEIVNVEGMSDGTADQLYLAVRLASLEAYIDKNEPMPFIVDDILIKFDDGRSVATLQVLAKLSEKTQVIFFTHNRHLVELAETQVKQDVLFTHSLNNC